MPVSSITPAGHGQDFRSYTAGTGHMQYVIPTTARQVSASVSLCTPIISGLASAAHNLFFVQNTAGSAVLMAVNSLLMTVAYTVAMSNLATSMQTFKVTSSLPTGGTACVKTTLDSTQSSSASCIANSASSADSTASAITWTAPAGTAGYRQFAQKSGTGAGQFLYPITDLIPPLCAFNPIILRPGEALMVQANIASATGAQYLITATWDEFTLV